MFGVYSLYIIRHILIKAVFAILSFISVHTIISIIFSDVTPSLQLSFAFIYYIIFYSIYQSIFLFIVNKLSNNLKNELSGPNKNYVKER
jgi:TRAP-type C4-dicarboxylate transport system permease small subunit